MAGDRETLFLLDDDEGMGGFNDGPPEPESTEPVNTDKAIPLDEEVVLPEVKEEAKPETDDNAEPASTDEGNKEPDKAPEIDPAEQRWHETIAMIAKKDSQIETLVDQVRALTETVVKPKEEPAAPQPPQKPTFTAAEWEDDYDGCTNAVIDYRERLKEFNSELERTQVQAEQQKTVSNIQAIHQKDYADECEELPALTDPKIKQVFANIYYDPNNRFNTKPDGVFRAVKELKRQAKERKVDLATFAPGYTPPSSTPPADSQAQQAEAEKIKSDEAARKNRVAAGAMHTGGKQSKDISTTLTAAQKDAARKFGVSEDVYAKTLAAMPGGKK